MLHNRVTAGTHRRYTAILRSAPECSITLWVGAASALNIVAVKEHSPVWLSNKDLWWR